MGVRRLVTAVSTACAMASNPAALVTPSGCDSVSSGSSSATRKVALASPQAIFNPVSASAITA